MKLSKLQNLDDRSNGDALHGLGTVADAGSGRVLGSESI